MTDENKESIYELIYDEESIRSLISEIIANCSIRQSSICGIKASFHCSYTEVENKINSVIDLNGNKIYENVSNIRREGDFDRAGGNPVYSFSAHKLVSPGLVDFLITLLNGEKIDYEWFISRKELSIKQELQLQIERIDSQINEISNFETKIKIRKLDELAIIVRDLNDIPEFNYDLLSKYYDIAQDCIQLELVQKTVKFQKKLTPKIYSEKQ